MMHVSSIFSRSHSNVREGDGLVSQTTYPWTTYLDYSGRQRLAHYAGGLVPSTQTHTILHQLCICTCGIGVCGWWRSDMYHILFPLLSAQHSPVSFLSRSVHRNTGVFVPSLHDVVHVQHYKGRTQTPSEHLVYVLPQGDIPISFLLPSALLSSVFVKIANFQPEDLPGSLGDLKRIRRIRSAPCAPVQ
jgi:hypothetical protein